MREMLMAFTVAMVCLNPYSNGIYSMSESVEELCSRELGF